MSGTGIQLDTLYMSTKVEAASGYNWRHWQEKEKVKGALQHDRKFIPFIASSQESIRRERFGSESLPYR